MPAHGERPLSIAGSARWWYVVRMRALIVASTLLVGVAHAQPPAAQDPVLAEQIATALVDRATELFEAKLYVDAKQLANEALVRSPRGTAADRAKHLIAAINKATGTAEPTPPPVDLTPIREPATQPAPPPVVNEGRPTAYVRSLASGVVWGGALGGLFADAVNVDGTKASHVAIGAGIGAAAGGLAGYTLGKRRKPTRGDVALIDTLAGIGGAGGFTLGMLMQPAESEAYSVNAIIGIAGGALVGYIAAPQTNTTERRMLRVAGLSLAGGALPFLLYAGIYDDSSDTDERVVGALSTAGLLAGAFLGFRMTRHMDPGKDLPARATEDAPVALLGRHSNGEWTANGIGIAPLSPQLAPQPGMAVSILGGRF